MSATSLPPPPRFFLQGRLRLRLQLRLRVPVRRLLPVRGRLRLTLRPAHDRTRAVVGLRTPE